MTKKEKREYDNLTRNAEQIELLLEPDTAPASASGKVYGYCRISTPKQSIERQIRNIKAAYPDAVIIQEAFSGTTMARPKWEQLYNRLEYGDTVVFDSVSRMSRDAAEGYKVYETLFKRGVELIFLKEPHVNTSTYKSVQQVSMTGTDADLILAGVNQYLLRLAERQIQLAFGQSEKEVADLRQRTKEGIETARIAGKQIGRTEGDKLHIKKKGPAKDVIRRHSRSFGGSLDDEECMKLAGVSRVTYYKYKKEIKAETVFCN